MRQIQRLLEEQIYIADAAIATALYLSMALGKPLLIEGPAGVGKTEIAKSLAHTHGGSSPQVSGETRHPK